MGGKVERAQKTDLDEYYSTVSLDAADLEEQLVLWQHFYNWHRPHGGLNGKSPMERYFELIHQTPLSEEIEDMNDPSKKRIRISEYQLDLIGQIEMKCLNHTPLFDNFYELVGGNSICINDDATWKDNPYVNYRVSPEPKMQNGITLCKISLLTG